MHVMSCVLHPLSPRAKSLAMIVWSSLFFCSSHLPVLDKIFCLEKVIRVFFLVPSGLSLGSQHADNLVGFLGYRSTSSA
ncbi:hypothetical protein BDW68DRAFT_161791 [Aspergillus falconensis]